MKLSLSFHRPENVPRLFDLIKVKDEAVKTAFYFALRDTLVAKVRFNIITVLLSDI